MRELVRGLILESKYPGVRLGAVVASEEVLLVDSPIRTEDGREWLSALAAHGRPRYLALLDHHPDRVLGARGIDLPIIAHDWTRTVMLGWPDTFKGSASPIGGEADRLKRITGVRRAIPDLTFSDELRMQLDGREVIFRHRPGPTEGAMWVEVTKPAVVFLGDAVSLTEPPYLGEADIEQWLVTLEALRCPGMRNCVLISSRDGRVDAASVSAMLRFLRKVPDRLEKLAAKGKPPEAAAALAGSLLEGFRVSQARREQALLRLQTGLARLYSRKYPPGG